MNNTNKGKDTCSNEEYTNEELSDALVSEYYSNRQHQLMKCMLVMASLAYDYYTSYIDKEPCCTSTLSGWGWVTELLTGHHDRIYENLRMNKEVFLELCSDLVNIYEFKVPLLDRAIRVEESVAMFLLVLGQGVSVQGVQERFQHSGETVHRHFYAVLDSIKKLAAHYCRPVRDQNFVHPYLKNGKYRAFKDCIGALDGTHIQIRPPAKDPIPYFGRKGCYTQNILAVYDFDKCFTFISAGWEGSMHDTRVFYNVIMDPKKNFPYPQEDKYYLVDAGYPNTKGYLAPYKGDRYHHQEFRRGDAPRNENEIFNQAHSSLRSVIERTFGVWKARWAILRDMPAFELDVQTVIVGGSMALHNYIRQHHQHDEEFDRIEHMEDFEMEDELYDVNANTDESQLPNDDGGWMSVRRDLIRSRIMQIRRRRSI